MEPDQPRRRATARVRWATAAVAGGALVATGALTAGVAQAHPAAGGTSQDTAGTGGTTSGTAGSSGSASTDQRSQQQLTPPSGVRPGHSGGSHASSGGS